VLNKRVQCRALMMRLGDQAEKKEKTWGGGKSGG